MIFKTTFQRKSAVVTTVFTGVILFLLFFCGLNYKDPAEEYGVAINFGTSDVGQGDPKLNESVASKPVEKKTEKTQENIEEKNEVKEEDLIQDSKEAVVLNSVEKNQKKIVLEPVKKVEKKIVKKVQKPTKETQDLLSNLFGKTAAGKKVESEGDDDVSGVKGAETGEVNSNKYYGNNGLGGEGNYLLKGRRALSKPIRKPDCNEEGVVVVRIEVGVDGGVIKAVPGVKGTTNNSPCLLEPALKAALATKWNPDGNAPNRQVGLIRYKFILSE